LEIAAPAQVGLQALMPGKLYHELPDAAPRALWKLIAPL
jgi:hypothetical protein